MVLTKSIIYSQSLEKSWTEYVDPDLNIKSRNRAWFSSDATYLNVIWFHWVYFRASKKSIFGNKKEIKLSKHRIIGLVTFDIINSQYAQSKLVNEAWKTWRTIITCCLGHLRECNVIARAFDITILTKRWCSLLDYLGVVLFVIGLMKSVVSSFFATLFKGPFYREMSNKDFVLKSLLIFFSATSTA